MNIRSISVNGNKIPDKCDINYLRMENTTIHISINTYKHTCNHVVLL